MNESITGVGKANDSSHLLSTLKKQNLFSNCNRLAVSSKCIVRQVVGMKVLFSISDKDKKSLWMSAASSHFKIERKRPYSG